MPTSYHQADQSEQWSSCFRTSRDSEGIRSQKEQRGQEVLKTTTPMSETSLNSDARRQSRKSFKSTSRGVQGNVSFSSRLEDPRNSHNFPLSHSIATPSKLIGVPCQPGVIARLMGIDAIPNPVKIPAEETSYLKSPPTEIKVFSPRSAPFKQAKCSLLSYRSRTGDTRHCLKKMRVLGRSRSRQRHPQEHLLQKIKEDFQSWQASKALESATTVAALGNNSKHLDGRCIQIIAQENLRKEKMTRYGYGNNKRAIQNGCSMKNVVQPSDTGNATKVWADAMSEEKKIIRVLKVNNRAASENFRDLEVGRDGNNQSASEKFQSPALIVLLKPSSDRYVDGGELLFGLSKMKRDDGTEGFLEEVKKRLQKELKLKCTSDLRTINWGAEPKPVVQDIVTHIKQTSTTDLVKRLSRSEAFRAFRSDHKRNHTTTGAKLASPEHFKIDTRSMLVHRPNNVTPRTETVAPKKDDEPVDSVPIRSRGRIRSLTDIPLTDMSFNEQTCTSSECLIEKNVDYRMSVGTDILPQRKLVRSFSAPESVVSQIRLFLEESVDSRNHGASDIASENGAMTIRSSSFSFRETVSSLRHRFSFRGKLFGRKMKPSYEELYPPQFTMGISPSPSESSRLYNFAQANFAELSPSPVSPLEIVGQSSRHFFSDLNCSLPELSRNCPSEFEAPASELSFRTDMTDETACNQDKTYLREVLIAAGLYDDGSLDNKANARVDSIARPLCDYIFDEVEDIYYYRDKNGGEHDIGLYNNSGGNTTDRRMLFDLANEALQVLVQGAKTSSSLCQWVIDNTGVSRGRKLVDDVWQQVQALRYPQMQEMHTIDSMVAFEVRKSLWADVLYEDVYVIGRKIERVIFDELIEDLLLEVFNN